MRHARELHALFALLALGACSGTYVAEKVDGVDSGPAASGADARANDADVRPPVDASPDVAPSDAGSPCATGAHLFCDDFDRGALGANWDTPAKDGGLLELATEGCSSPPSCLRVAYDRYEAGATSELSRDLAFPANGLGIDADVTVVGTSFATGSMGTMFVSMTEYPGTRFRHFNLDYSNSTIAIVGANVLDDGGSTGDLTVAASASTERRHLRFRLTAKDGKVKGSLEVDSSPAAVVELSGPPPTRVNVRLGVAYRSGATGGRITVDNVVIDSL
jgi:hypothetical protein